MVKPRTFLANTHPHLREQFLYALDKDGKLDEATTFNMLASRTHRKCAWKCLKTNCKRNCEHIFIAAVCNRTSENPTDCPKCSGHKVCPCNSLSGKFPDIVKQWDYERNLGLNPEEISPKSRLIVHWKCITYDGCKCHRWKTSICNRTIYGSSCPFCCQAPRNVCEHKNAATEYPDLAAEWHPQKNGEMKLSEFAPRSNHLVWWKCAKCLYDWKTGIANRTDRGTNCPRCKDSKMERAMAKVLEEFRNLGIVQSFDQQWRMRATRFRADFRVILTDDNIVIVIETDGVQHFEPRSFGSSRSPLEMLERVKEWDQQKKEWCMNNKIHLLRISYLVKFEHFQAEVLEFFEKVKRASQNETLFQIVGQPQ